VNEKSTKDHQEFPTSGPLADNLDRPLPGWDSEFPEQDMPRLQPSEIGNITEDDADHVPTYPVSSGSEATPLTPETSKAPNLPYPVFAYVLTSVKESGGKFFQEGCAPNFQGERITLCTCMHRHRTWWKTWLGVWIAGFTKKRFDNQLFYLMQVGQQADSQFELWNSPYLPDRNAKSASLDKFGDVFEPGPGATCATKFAPASYNPPVSNHVHVSCWQNDICYKYGALLKKQPKLLVGIPARSFLWSCPKRRYNGVQHPRFKLYQSLRDFYNHLM
jgi:hypothetical protein